MAHFREFTIKIINEIIQETSAKQKSNVVSINWSESLHKDTVLKSIVRAAFNSQFDW